MYFLSSVRDADLRGFTDHFRETLKRLSFDQGYDVTCADDLFHCISEIFLADATPVQSKTALIPAFDGESEIVENALEFVQS